MGNENTKSVALDVLDGLGNTRPPNTQESALRSLVDWVSIAFDLNGDYEDVFDLLGLGKLDFEIHEYGRDTYTSHARFSNIVIQKKHDFNYQLYLTGQGCREFEDYSTLDWYQLFSILKDLCNGKATRIDVAIDDFRPYYTVKMIRDTFHDGRCRTRIRRSRTTQEHDTSDLNLVMDSFYLGSINSRLSINFYDKKLEREAQGFEVTEESWTRTELRCKREYADQVVDLLLLNENIGQVIRGILKSHVSFIRKSKQQNKSRVPNIKWWDDFLNNVNEINLSVKAPDKTIQKTKDWISHSVAPALATLKKADPIMYEAFMLDILKEGEERLNQTHESMIKQYNDEKYRKAKEKLKEINKDVDITNLHERLYKNLNKKSPFPDKK